MTTTIAKLVSQASLGIGRIVAKIELNGQLYRATCYKWRGEIIRIDLRPEKEEESATTATESEPEDRRQQELRR